MIMKDNKLLNMFVLLMVAMVCAGCPGDSGDDKTSDSSDNNSLIQTLKANKWIMRDYSYGEGRDDHAWLDQETTFLYFTSNYEGISYWIQKDYDTELGNSLRKEYTLFTYTVSGNMVTITDESGYKSSLFYTEGFLMSETGSQFYEASPMSASDYDLLRSIGPKSGTSGGSISYSFDDRTGILTIKGKGRMNDYTSTNQPWHDYAIKSIIIEDGCTYVGTHAFHNLKYAVADVTLPSSVTEIGDYAFCDLLIDKISIPGEIVRIGKSAFADCTYLKDANFAGCDNLETIDEWAFGGCPLQMGYFKIPKNVRTIGEAAFGSATFTNLTLNDKLEAIGDAAFGGLGGAVKNSKIVIPNSVSSIGSKAFVGTFTEIRIGTGVRSMGNVPFLSSKYSSSGSMYVNLGVPLSISSYDMIICNGYGNDAASSWTLYVPKGSQSAYSNATGWKKFKSINEDPSLTSGNGSPGNQESGDNTGDNSGQGEMSDVVTKPITYKIDGLTYRTILVEGASPFYIMQSEIPVNQRIQIGTKMVEPLDRNGDEIIIKAEMSAFLIDIREASGMPFRLPYKAEWQYAAMGGVKSGGYTYSGSNYIDDVAWYSENSNRSVHDIALKKPNELGLYDMSGNYAELCYNEGHDEVDVDGPICGGSWKDAAYECKVSSWKEGVTSGRVRYTGVSEKNACDAQYITIRLVYPKQNEK